MIGERKLMNEESKNEKRQSVRPESARLAPFVDCQSQILRSSITDHRSSMCRDVASSES